jgi:hypothetical protein
MNASLIVAILFFGMVLPTYAQVVCNVQSPQNHSHIMVFQPGKTGEVYALERNNIKGELFSCCVACLVRAGTKVIVTNLGSQACSLRVLEGPTQDCIGELPPEYLKNCQ